MAFLTEEKFQFVSQALPENTFGVVRFKGSEGLSKTYEFEIDLVAADPEIDLDKVLQNPATFTIIREEGDIPFHGILARFEQLHAVDEYIFYRAVLVPKLWWLNLTHHNQAFLNKTVPEILQEVLKDGGLTTLDFELRLRNTYPQWEYICQYRASHLDFVSRWMERDGMYFYFEQNENGEKVIITDTRIAHSEMPQEKTMVYSPPSGLDEAHREEVIKAFVCRQKMLPKNLRLKDYNYRTPSLEVSGNAQVKTNGRGDVYIYGEHFRTPEEGNALAKVRAEELLCREKLFYGEGTIPYLRTGYLFGLQDHYRSSFNQNYLTVEIGHEGSQAAYLLAGIQKGLSEMEAQPYYRNSFVAIPAEVQFRPERKTEKARFYGIMNAKIDAAGSGKYAELDEQGRYKVILPFDLSGRKDGKASAYLRMAQPYAGTDHGMHFPLHKGTEVLLTFIDGDPDRPIIQGAVPNPEMPSQVTSADQTMSKITTAGGNKIHMEDEEGKERILLHSPNQGSFIRIGAHNDPIIPGMDPAEEAIFFYHCEEFTKGAAEWLAKESGIALSTAGKFVLNAVASYFINTAMMFTRIDKVDEKRVTGLSSKTVLGANSTMTIGRDSKTTIGFDSKTTIGDSMDRG
ncbi:MAG: type VI secretion system tip protein TssI/VgrG [Pseudomonadota bacterium]